MKPASRVQAIIEILTEVLKDKTPCDVILDNYFKQRRYIGSKDRRFISDNVWKIIRNRTKYTQMLENNATPRLLVAINFIEEDLDVLFSEEEYAPRLLTKEEKQLINRAKSFENFDELAFYECPKWLFDKFENKELLASLNSTATLDVRANLTSREMAKERLKKEGLFFSFTPYSPIGLRCVDRINLNNCMTYQDGEIEVMDEASQIISLLCRVKAHHKTIDYCAGAGGKSLAIAATLSNEGLIYAHDISVERLSRIKKRAERLDITNIKTITNVVDKDYDRFIIDAPCSGSGTWRRCPDAKYRLSQEKLDEIIKTQREILEFGAKHTKNGGRLIYITCSVFKEENEKQIENFLNQHTEFTPLNHKDLWQDTLDSSFYPFNSTDYISFSPLLTKTDGFFVCVMKKS